MICEELLYRLYARSPSGIQRSPHICLDIWPISPGYRAGGWEGFVVTWSIPMIRDETRYLD
ncbi:hypothetical protein I7I53_10817 [Histoplasma capsulatum var. duboisii H88]|uniref:Uncharacterized protein n=1 Tax=Ajellomyces capsulatus (strain H88) TaxID=544711 RepID=A0A8A1L9A7_AJEC8|nr:hypothetical protein I7I53_10817 [Histoplasma capsulatum var. duboisii H88]